MLTASPKVGEARRIHIRGWDLRMERFAAIFRFGWMTCMELGLAAGQSWRLRKSGVRDIRDFLRHRNEVNVSLDMLCNA